MPHELRMPVSGNHPLQSISMDHLNERQAWLNHGQTLDVLCRQGGLRPQELVANMQQLSLTKVEFMTDLEALTALDGLC